MRSGGWVQAGVVVGKDDAVPQVPSQLDPGIDLNPHQVQTALPLEKYQISPI